MKTLANHIENELQHGLWSHCAIYEDELQHFWPLEAPYREVRIGAFAAKYGYRLRFYHKGMCAIFDRQPDEEAASAIKGPQRTVLVEAIHRRATRKPRVSPVCVKLRELR